MNSEVQTVVKLEYVYSTCNELCKDPNLEYMLPTLEWMRQETVDVYNRIMYTAEPKKRDSWARQVNRVSQHIKTLQDEGTMKGYKPVTEAEGSLFLMSAVTQMLEDISLVPSKKALVQDLLTAAYTLEKLVKLPKKVTYGEDSVYEHAGTYLKGIYRKIAEMH